MSDWYRTFTGVVRHNVLLPGDEQATTIMVNDVDLIATLIGDCADRSVFATVGVWDREWSGVLGPLCHGQREDDDWDWTLDEDGPARIQFGIGQSWAADYVDLSYEVGRYHDNAVRLWVRGRHLDPQVDPEHPRYDPLVEAVLATHVAGLGGPLDRVTVTRSRSESLDRGGRLYRACPKTCDMDHEHQGGLT